MNVQRLQAALRRSSALRTLLYPALAIRRLGIRYQEGIANKLLDNLAQLLCEDPVICVNDFHGRFAAGRQSALFRRLVKNKRYEPELVATCLKHMAPGRDAIDIGANIGLYTVLFAKSLRGRRILSVEPIPDAVSRLRRNIQLNGIHNSVIVFAGAAADHSGAIEINTIAEREEYSSVGAMAHPSIAGATYLTITVPCSSIDALTVNNDLDPGFIKIDVEGMEHMVLNGMRQVLKRNRPVVLSELSDPLLRKNGSSAESIINFFKGFGYNVTDPLNPHLVAGKRAFGDILCVPAEC